MADSALIDHLASLSHLSFEGAEKERMAVDMESIMKLMDTVAVVAFSDAEEQLVPDDGMDLLREDIPADSMPAEVLFSNAKEKVLPFVAVPKIMD